MPKLCLPKIRIECCKPACEPKPCDPCGGCGHFAKLRGLFHHGNGCCEAKPACGGCGHSFSLHGLFGKRCCANECAAPCNGGNGTAAPAEQAPQKAPSPTPMSTGTNSGGLLILTPAG
jgi:hypothetical protein